MSSQSLPNIRRYPLASLLLMLALIAAVLIWEADSEYRISQRQELTEATQAALNAADQVALYLQGLSQSLTLFSELEHEGIDALAMQPANRKLQARIWKRIRTFFPTAYSFTLTDLYGNPLFSDLGKSAEHQGFSDLLELTTDQTLPVDVHRESNGYHFHVVAGWHDGEEATGGHIVVDFRCGILCQMLFHDQPQGLNLQLVKREATGSKAQDQDPGRILAQARIPGTHWNVIRLADPSQPESEHQRLLRQKLIVFLILAVGTLLLMFRASRQRQSAGGEIPCLQDLRENEKKLGTIVDAAGEGIILADARGRIHLFNPAAEAMFGYTREEASTLRMDDLVPRPLDVEPDQYFSQFTNHGKPVPNGSSRELLGRRKDGEKFPIRISVNQYLLEEKPHFVVLIQDISEQIEAQKRLDYVSTHDTLTGLMNRREFERLLESLLSIPKSENQQHVLCYIDVDQFKVINDTLGHIAGDDLLRQIGVLIKAQLRETGTIARLGGDEFGVLLGDCTIERAQEVAHGLLQTIGNFLFTWKDKSFEVGVSIGLAAFNPDSDLGSNVLSAADVACHMAKEQGRNRIHVYHPGDVDLIRHHGDMHLVSRITQALNEERFHLYAQPIVPVKTSSEESRHYEVLVRMVDESGKLVIPDKFIPAAERYILMPAIDRWIISSLFSTQGDNLRTWAKLNHGRGFLFAINLSGTSLSDEGFLSYIKRQFSKWDIPYNAVCFEITETAAIANLSRARELISSLKELGCYFALDDFGAGLSSFSYLKDLPVDYLKIDGSFVRHMTEDPVDYAMVESINQIGHILGLKTIAEWAEDNATLTLLRALNVDFAQGYGVGEPEPMRSFVIR